MVSVALTKPAEQTAPDTPWGTPAGPPTVWPTEVQKDLLRATLLPDERALAAWQRIRPLMSVAELDGTVGALLPQLRVNLAALGCEDSMLELFKGVHRHTWARNQLLLAQTMPVVGALEAAGIRTLLLKGAGMVADGRHEGGVRPMTDVDVLVAPEDVEAAVDVLLEHRMDTTDGTPVWYAIGYGQRYRNSWNFRTRERAELDLHFSALAWSRHPEADAGFWSASEPVTLHGVATRALSPADDLLTAIAHGLRWDPKPTYRWALDAALAVRSPSRPADWDKLVSEARRRRLEVLVRTGLGMLGELAGVEIPSQVAADLGRGNALQRLELRAQLRQPRRRDAAGQQASAHLADLRRSVRPGAPVSPLRHLRLAARRLGRGRIPGPGRPACESSAAIGTGIGAPRPLAWGRPLELGDPDRVRAHCLYGLWPPDQGFAWIAGRGARLILELPEPAPSSLLLTLATGCVSGAGPQRLEVAVGGEVVGEVDFERTGPYVDGARMMLPARIVAGRSRLELVLRAPGAIVPARRGINDDLRLLGVNLHRLTLTPAAHGDQG